MLYSASAGTWMSASPHVAFRVSGGAGVTGGGAAEYRLLSADAAAGDNAGPAQQHPWHSVAAAGGAALTLRNLPDGAYVLQLRSGAGSAAGVEFFVDTNTPRTRVQNVTRRAASDGSSSAHWRVEATGLDCGSDGGGSGGSAVTALWWAAAETATIQAGGYSLAQWQRVNLSAATVSLSTPLRTTVLRVKAEDAAGNVDPFPRTISWGHALSLRSAPRATTFQTSATFSLGLAASVAPPSSNVTRALSPAVRWRLDGAAWQSVATKFPASIRLSSLAPGPHVWEAQPVAGDGSADAVQSTPVYHTWEVLSSASLDGSGMTFADLPDGPHKLEARAVDAAGNVDSSNATYRWRVDTTPPSCSAALDWGPAVGGGRVFVNGSEPMALVQLKLDNASVLAEWSVITISPPLRHTAIASPAVTHDGLHSLSVKAMDAVGNTATLPCAVLRWLVDTTAPTISLLSPLGIVGKAAAVMNRRVWNATVSAWDRLSPVVSISYAVVHSRGEAHHAAAASHPVVLQWRAMPASGSRQLDDKMPPSTTVSASVPASVPVSVPGDGRYSLWLRAVDAAGNVAMAPAMFNWTVDTAPPAVTLHAAGNRGAVLPSVTAQHWLSIYLHFNEPLGSLWWAVSEHSASPQPSQQLQQQRHYARWVAEAVDSGTLLHSLNVTSGSADGQYILALKAADVAGNSWSNNTAHAWIVDTTAPTSCTVSTPSAMVNSSRVLVSFGPFGGLQGIVGHWYALVTAGAPWVWRPSEGARSMVVQLPAPAGQGHNVQHVLKVKAVDAAGNMAPQPCASLFVTIDTTPPVTAVHSPSEGAALRTSSPRITLRHSEPVARVRWWWQYGESEGVRHVVSSTQPSNTSSFAVVGDAPADGVKTIWIQAEDTAGNMEATAVRFSWVKDTQPPAVILHAATDSGAAALRAVVAHHWLPVCAHFSEPLDSLQWAVSEHPAPQPHQQQHAWVAESMRGGASHHHCMNVTSGSVDGQYILALKAADVAGNSWRNNTAHVWRVDTTVPTSCTVSTPSATVNSSRVLVSFGPFGGLQGIVGHWYALATADAPWEWKPTGGARSTVVQLPAPAGQGHNVQHVLQVKAVDAAGNIGAQPCASLFVTVDTTPPVTAVHSPSWGATLRTPSPRITLYHSEPVVRVSWRLQSDGASGGVSHVVSPTSPSNVTFIDAVANPSTDGVKTIWIQAEDRAGNMEVAPVRFSWVKDAIAPSIGIVGSLVPSQRRVASTRLELAVAVRDRNALQLGRLGTGVWYSAHVLTVTAPDVTAPLLPLQWTLVAFPASTPPATMHRLPLTVAVTGNGWYVLALKAVDAAGNTAVNRSALRWVVDTTPPVAVVDHAPWNTTLGRGAEARFSFRCTSLTACKRWGGHQPCTPVADCAAYRYRVVATALGVDRGCSSAAVEIVPWTTSTSRHISLRSALLRAGYLRLEVKAVDAVSLLQLRASAHTWTVSPSQEVVVSAVNRPPALSAWDVAPFTFTASMGGAPYSGQRFQLRVDTETGPWQTLPLCLVNQSTCSHMLRGIARGSHVVHARAVDAGSGIASSPVSVRWTLGVCNATAYAQVNASDGALRCFLCPAGANCTADDTTLLMMGAQTGWWAAAGRVPSTQFYPCSLPGSCEGGGNATQTSSCAPTFDSGSVMCGGCAAGHVRRAEACTACPEAAVGVALVVLCTLLLVAFICFSSTADASPEARSSGRRESASVAQRILISFLSTLTTIGDFRARGPQLVQDFIGLTSMVSGGVSVRFAPIRCTLGLGFFAELLATLGMPFFLLCCCTIVVAAHSRMNPQIRAREAMLGCAVFTALLVYPTLTRATLQVFRCTDVEVDGSRYLLHDLTVQCFRGTHSGAMLVSALATAVVGLGVPATIIARVATAKTSGARLQLKRTYQFIFDGYLADRLLWWEALVLLRKFALQCVEVFIADATIQASVASWIIVAAVALHLWWRPYNSALLNRLDALSLSVSYVTQALSSAYPLLLSSGGRAAVYAEVVVTVVLLGLNIGTIAAMAALALRWSALLQRRRRVPHTVAAAASPGATVQKATTITAVVPAPVSAARSIPVDSVSLHSSSATASMTARRAVSRTGGNSGSRTAMRPSTLRPLLRATPAVGAQRGEAGARSSSRRHRHPRRNSSRVRRPASLSSSAAAASRRRHRSMRKGGNSKRVGKGVGGGQSSSTPRAGSSRGGSG